MDSERDTMTPAEIKAATFGALERELARACSWIDVLKYEYSQQYRIERDAILEEIELRSRAAEAELQKEKQA